MDKELDVIICDRLEGWELVEFLQISTEDVIEAFRDQLEDNLADVKDFIGLDPNGDPQIDD